MSTDQVGHPVDTQSITNALLQDLRGVLDGVTYDIYFDSPMGDTPVQQSIINQAYYAHANSPYKGYVKRSVVIFHDWQGDDTNFATGWKTWLAQEMSDRDWWRIDGRPVIWLFDPIGWNNDATAKAAWLSVKASLESTLASPLYAIGTGGLSTVAWSALGLVGGTSYDGGLGASLSPNVQHPWSDQVTKDLSNGGQANFDLIETVSVRQDNRPRKGESGTGWADEPSFPDEIAAFTTVIGFHPKLIMASPVDELDESGGFIRTVPDGTRWLDGLRYALRPAEKPGSYPYKNAARTKYFTQTGSWAPTTGQAGPYKGEYLCSSTTSDTVTILCDSHLLGSSTSATVTWYAEKSTTSGIADFTKNGTSQGTVDLGGSLAWAQNVKSYTCSSGDTIGFVVTGTHSIGSTNAVCFDALGVTYAP